jgi:diguanylate cyclase (GGDEF)-like protein
LHANVRRGACREWKQAYVHSCIDRGSQTRGAVPLCAAVMTLLVTLSFALAARAAAPPPLADYFAERWSSRDGLPHNMVSSIVQSPDGYLWMSTLEGAVRYNGREFKVYDSGLIPDLRGNAMRGVAVSEQGVVLVATTRDGIARLREGRWDFLRPPGAGSADVMITVAAGRDGRIWAGGENGGVYRFDSDGSSRRFSVEDGLPSVYVNALLKGRDGRLWVGTTRGLAWIDDETVQAIAPSTGLPTGTVLSLALLSDQRLLVGTDRGLFVQAGEGFRLFSAGVPQDTITRLMLDSEGHLWVGTTSFGVFRVADAAGAAGAVERLDVEDGLPNSRVSALAQDREGSVWIGTNAGLFRLRLPPVRMFSRRQGLQTPYVRAVAEAADGSLWVGTSGGLYRLGSDALQMFQQAQGLPADSILSLHSARDGTLWVGTASAGLARRRDGVLETFANRASGLAGDQVRALQEGRNGTLWVGTTLGLSRIREGIITNFTTAQGLPRDFVISLHESADGRIWVGTSNGAGYVDGDRVVPIRLGNDPIKDIFDFHEDIDGSLWLSTDLGLLRYHDGPTGRVTRASGLPVDAVFGIIADASGGWWLSSNRGIVHVDAAAARGVADGRSQSLAATLFNEADGMESAQCNGAAGPAALARVDGSLWFGTASGLAVLDPVAVLSARPPPVPVTIERLRVDDIELPPEGGHRLAAGSRRIEFRLAGLSLLMPERIRFRYRLEGFEERWIELGDRREVQFTSLPPGEYRFLAQAANPGGAFSAAATALTFEVLPFWWQRPTAWVLGAFGVLSLVGLATQLRLGQLQRAKRRLQKLVDEKTAALERKAASLEQIAREKSLLAERLRAQAEAFERQANEDYLTGLLNRRAFDAQLAQAFADANRRGDPLCLALIDIDFFKRINDQCSHAAGDTALREVAMLIREHCPGVDVASRWGGEEFAVLFPGQGPTAAVVVCERLRAAVAARVFDHLQPGLRVTVSIGVASHDGLPHPDRLFSRADAALYRAKAEGRDRVCS